MSNQQIVNPFRLAFRTEGAQVNCYIAPTDTMEGARLLSCMPRRVLQADDSIWQDWKALMQRVMTVICKEALNATPVNWVEEPGPEHEKSGHS